MPTHKTYPITGVAYVAQIENEYMNANKLSVCGNCMALGFQKPVSRCRGCLISEFCSKECQKAQWSKHKPFCNMVQGKGKKNAYLTAQDRDEILRIVIDAYRLRVEIDHIHRNEDHGLYYPGTWEDGIVWVQGETVDDFQKWLDMIERSGILPDWWRFEDRMKALAMAVDKNNQESIHKPLDQEQLIIRYGKNLEIRNALCILAELVVGYEGKGAPKDDQWFMQFQEHLDLHPEERARLIKGSVDAVRDAYEKNGEDFSLVDPADKP